MASKDEQSDLFLASDAMSDDFFIDIVEKKLKIARDKFKLRLVVITPAAGKNENFVCVVYRAKVKIQLLETKENVSVDVIIKALLSTLKEFKEFGVFPRERFMYENILKSFEDIWYERTGKEIQFAPRSIKFETDPYELIVMDDLKAMEYAMLDRKIGADFSQTKVMLCKLAKFHAASAIRYQKVRYLVENNLISFNINFITIPY
jgi:ATP-dependent exoDNAse (exonuclease V) alpha subunit